MKSNVLHPYPGGWTNELSLGMPWVVLEHENGASLYVGNHDDGIAFSCFMAELDVELRLDAESQAAFGNSAPQRWPPDAGADSTVTLAWALFPFLQPGASFEGPPVVFRVLEGGGWRAAVECFRAGLEERLGTIPRRRTWLADADAWAAVCMLFNDGTVTHRVSDLPRLAADAAEAGISTLVLAGWSCGGLDGGLPFYRLDPRLGTEAEFSAALNECRASGVRVVALAQVQQICAETEWFRMEGHRYLVQNENGDPYYYGGVHYGTKTLLFQLGFGPPQILTANPAHPELQELILEELARIVEYGLLDGILLDKLHTGDPYSLDFNPRLPGTPSTRFHRAVENTVRAFADSVAEDFAIAAEASWDRVMPYCEAVFARYFEREHLPVQELAFPGVRLTTTIVGDGDTNMVNNALRHGHIICLEPHYLHGGVADVPHLARYVREVLDLRRRLRPLLWYGALADPARVEVIGDDILHGVFEPAADAGAEAGALALVLNHFQDAKRHARVSFADGWARAAVYRPFRDPEMVDTPLEVSVPAGEYVVVVPHDR
jgi:hypothetical protein